MSIDITMDDSCFACGDKNENGLRLKIFEKEGGVWAKINPPTWSQGYSRIVHGGVIATILDEMAVWAAFKRGYRTVTAELNMRIRKSMHVDRTYTARARILNLKHRLVEAESEIFDVEDSQVANARVKLLKVEQ